MIWRILLLWLLVANTAYGSVPGHRPVAYGYGVDYLTSSVWRERAVDPTGLYWLGDRYYDPISSQWLSHDHSWNNRDPNGQSYCGGDPVQGTDPKGKCVQNPPPALYFGTAPVMQEYTATTRYFQNGSSIVTGLPGQPDQYFDQSQVTGYTYDRVTMPTGWDFSYVSEHPLPANYGQTTRRPVTTYEVEAQRDDQFLKATTFGLAMLATDTEEFAAENIAVRQGYLDALKAIPGQIDTTLPLREQAMQAFNLRNAAKIDARAAMSDGGALLNKTDPIPTIQDVVRRAYQEKGLVGDDMWRSILESSTRSRASVNQALGVKP